MIGYILFDLDGTLIDSAQGIALALNHVIARRGGKPVTVEQVRSLVSRGAQELVATAFASCPTVPEQDLHDFRSVYGALSSDPGHLYPGAAETLNMLARSGFRLGLCTNKPQDLVERILSALELKSLFGVILGGDSVFRPKPHPDHLRAAVTALAAKPGETVFVGDSEVDAEAAQNAGLPFVLVTHGYPAGRLEDIPHQGRIDRLEQLPDLLAAMDRIKQGQSA